MINLVDANSTYLTFSVLSPVLPNCSRLNYNIEVSNCGSCPNNTDSTIIFCSNFSTSIETNICNLTVGGVICGNMTGDRASALANLRGWSIVINLRRMREGYGSRFVSE